LNRDFLGRVDQSRTGVREDAVATAGCEVLRRG